MAQLDVKQDVRDTAVVVSVDGEVDSATVASLVAPLDTALKVALDHPTRVLVVEFRNVTYFGSAGLNAVLDCYEQGQSIGVSVRIVATSAEVIRPIEVTKLDEILRPYPTVTHAVNASEGC